MSKAKLFIGITNHDIYDKLLTIEKKLDITNGRVKLNRWMATTALTLSLFVIGYLLRGI